MTGTINKIIEIINESLIFIKSYDADTFYTEWNSIEEAINCFVDLEIKLSEGDLQAVNKLDILFAPTGSLQELAIAGGWSQQYLALASRFDQLASGLKKNT
jgi:hypothetical protein